MNDKNNFDDFLKEEGIYEETTKTAKRRVKKYKKSFSFYLKEINKMISKDIKKSSNLFSIMIYKDDTYGYFSSDTIIITDKIEKNNNNNIELELLTFSDILSILFEIIDEEISKEILSNLELEKINILSNSFFQHKIISKKEIKKILKYFYNLIKQNKFYSLGGENYTKEMLYLTLGVEKSKKILNNLSNYKKNKGNFSYLHNIENKYLSDFIINEHPQTIAIIVSHLDTKKASELLTIFPLDLNSEILLRISKLGDVNPNILKRVSTVLENKLIDLSSNKTEIGGINLTTNIISELSSVDRKDILSNISQIDEEISDYIQEKLFSYEDINKLKDEVIIEILKNVEKNDLLIALKYSSKKIKKRFLSKMSKRAKIIFKEEMKLISEKKELEYIEVQRKIVKTINKLNNTGVIEL